LAHIPSDINPSISHLVQNAQTFSPAVSKKARESLSQGKPKTHHVRKGSTDSTSLSDDMLGDMDPDEYRGKDNSAQMKNQMRSWNEEAEKKPPQSEEKQEESSAKDEDSYSDKEEEERKKKREQEALEEAEKQTEKARREAESEKETDESELSGEASDPRKELKKDSTSEKKPNFQEIEKNRSGESRPTSIQERESTSSIRDAAARRLEDKSREPHKQESNQQPERNGVFVKSPQQKEEKAPVSQSSQGFVSILSQHEGFIIADPRRVPTATEGNLPSSEKKPVVPVETTEEISAPMEERYRKVLSDLIIAGMRGQAYENLCVQLRNFGIAILEMCVEKGERILLLPTNRSLEDFPQFLSGLDSSYSRIRLGYLPLQKLVIFGEEVLLNNDPFFNVPILYTAFAFDHAMGGESFASEQSPAVGSNFKFCHDREPGHQFIDSFAATSPIHYFAQAVEAYLMPPRNQMRDNDPRIVTALCTCEEFYDIDRSMYMYVDYLFRKMKRGNETDPYQRSYKFKGVV
jgi:hypothetical protein